MLVNSPFLGSLLGGLGAFSVQKPNQTGDQTNAGVSITESVSGATDPPDSGGVKFDLASSSSSSSTTGTQDSGASATGSQADDDAAMAAYFYAAKWARSLQSPAEDAAAGNDAAGKFSFATEPYRRDIVAEYFSERTIHFMGKKLATIGADGVISRPEETDGAIRPMQVPKSLGKF